MRPVQLDLDGFGSFRTPSTVDFRDADWFALVGPTGAGKSTVVDAIIFALYGSVPRWEDRRAVGWALAPTATRGVVKLVFDVGSERYTAARELRRSAQGKVTVKNARLERGGEVIAADGEVSAAVERLLGLSYDHFVRCVILPQGDFARFLHSTAKERQDTLVDLLGIRIYREIAERARAEAATRRQQAEFAAGHLAGYADATEAAETAAAGRADALRALAATVAATVPELAEAARALSAADTEVRRLTGERTLLAALRVPPGLEELAERGRTAAAALALADDALAGAEKVDTAARDARDDAGDRAALEQARDAWAELAEVTAALPAALSERAAADARVQAVERDGAAAREAVTAAGEQRERLRTANLAAALRPHLVAGEPCPVCDQPLAMLPIEHPAPDLPAADRAVAAADAEVARLQKGWQAASRAAHTAGGRADQLAARAEQLRSRLAGRPDAARVGAALAELEKAEQEARAADRAVRDARRAREAAAAADRDAGARLAAARAGLDAARDPLVALGAPPPERADLAADWLALADWALAAAEQRDAQVVAAGQGRAAIAATLADREAALRAELTGHGVEIDPRRPLAEAAEPAVVAAEGRARGTAARIAERRAEAGALRETVRAAEEDAAVAKLLGQLLRADGFERWLLTSALDVLVADASATLLELSGGQFELTHDGKDFEVVDHADADSRRPVRTLSGGETFQASLALALALSAQLAGLAVGGTARLDTIVLDEGFGTLDESTLDVVASTLESLTAGGDRMVGVVTHVGALAERVPVRFAVTRTAAGSSVERQDV
ncbi:MAG TPA: SMC family ATPase [Mycobacteriales bacterium]|nr:SMC family ATPase [Mycobacteriales bacterium]